MDNQTLLTLAGKLILASSTGNQKEIESISNELAHLNFSKCENSDESTSSALYENVTGFLKIPDKEVLKMPKSFRHTFRTEGKTICYRKRIRGKISCSYEARYRRHGYNISVSATDLDKLIRRFIEALHEAENGISTPKVPTKFHDFAMYYFENFRKHKVGTQTYRVDLSRYKHHIQPVLGNIEIKKIIPAQCKRIMDNTLALGYEKTAQDTHSLLNLIFKCAIAHGILDRNPLAIVENIVIESKHGKSLTKEEEKKLLNSTAGTPYQLMFAVALYTGMRPNEYFTARIEGNFIIAKNSKQKAKKVRYKKIPITPMLKPYLEGVTELKFYILECIREKFKSILPNHRLYDLRTTFYTRCHECGVADVARMEFVGHSLGKLGNTYTDLSDEFLLKEGSKLNY